MNVEYLDAPDGIDATWYVAHDTLYIALAQDLDDVTRQRYIAQAKAEHGINPTRRRPVVPFLLPAGGIRHASPTQKIAFVGAGVAAAAGIAAAVVLPTALDSNQNSTTRGPSTARPAPNRSSAPPARHPPVKSPSKPPNRPRPPAEIPTDSPAAGQHPNHPAHAVQGHANHSRRLPGIRTPPPERPVPVPPPAARRPSRLLVVSLPPAGVSVRLSPRLKIHVRVGPKSP